MKARILAVSVMILAASTGFAQVANYPKAKVSFDDFKGLVAAVETHRASRLVDLNTFMKMSKEPGVIILDSRSTFRFDRIHLKSLFKNNLAVYIQASSYFPGFLWQWLSPRKRNG